MSGIDFDCVLIVGSPLHYNPKGWAHALNSTETDPEKIWDKLCAMINGPNKPYVLYRLNPSKNCKFEDCYFLLSFNNVPRGAVVGDFRGYILRQDYLAIREMLTWLGEPSGSKTIVVDVYPNVL